MIIWLASGNKHKQQELAAILENHTVKLPAEAEINDFDPEENGASFAENALIKARTLYTMLYKRNNSPPDPVLADDSGLCVDALGGRPGIYSARYFGKNSWNADGSFKAESLPQKKLLEKEQNLLLLEELYGNIQQSNSNSIPAVNKKCRFVCAMVLLFSPDRFFLIQETLEGEIVSSASDIKGAGGFGYDPVVYLPELGRTVAELSEDEKNKLSHRGKAGKAIAKLLC